jgi:hypothetical protein
LDFFPAGDLTAKMTMMVTIRPVIIRTGSKEDLPGGEAAIEPESALPSWLNNWGARSANC